MDYLKHTIIVEAQRISKEESHLIDILYNCGTSIVEIANYYEKKALKRLTLLN